MKIKDNPIKISKDITVQPVGTCIWINDYLLSSDEAIKLANIILNQLELD